MPSQAPTASGSGVLAGTSGFAFAEWNPGFYPADLKGDRMLAFYGEHLPTVEINVSFYRMPTSKMLEDWKAQTRPPFRFAIKAHRRITHLKRLRDVDEDVRWLYERVTELGGSVIHPGSRWAICRDSEGSPFGLALASQS